MRAARTCDRQLPAVVDAESSSSSGELFYACGAGAFPATVAVPVNDRMPAELVAGFPEGTSLQFILHDSRVDVFSDVP